MSKTSPGRSLQTLPKSGVIKSPPVKFPKGIIIPKPYSASSKRVNKLKKTNNFYPYEGWQEY
jgi:hypothetical protein